MAAGSIPAPGTKYGPCAAVCAHRDCEANRRAATARCPYCGESIGYDRNFYDTSSDGVKAGRVAAGQTELSHAVCYESAIERELAA